MKWMGWGIAVIAAVVLAMTWQQDTKSIRKAKARIDKSLDELQAEADTKVDAVAEGLVERRKSLGELRAETAELQTQRDGLESRKQEFTQKLKTLAEESERLRTTKDAMAGSTTENREELQELQERINQADRRVGLWGKMIDMVTLPGEAR